jgi:hypothetical protein
MSKNREVFQRLEKAKTQHAKLFLSIHNVIKGENQV